MSPPAAEALEEALGDPFNPHNVLSFERAVALDEAESYPADAVALLGRWGLLRHFVPASSGGDLLRFDESMRLLQLVSRRDLTCAIALGQTFLGSVAVWIAGTDAQKRQQAEVLFANGQAALALTEEAHGSDILANDVTAQRCDGGFVLRGEKWLINNGTCGRVLTVFARTDGEGGLGGFSLFRVDKRRLAPGSFEPLPKTRTHGIRGADISGVRFVDAKLGEDALIGKWGGGAELVIEALQLTRIGCAGFSLGAADSALRIALDFAHQRRLYGGAVMDIPHARSVLTSAFIELLACDALALSAARAVHAVPGQLSLISAVAKYFIPTRMERAIREVAVVLGARHYLREGFAAGAFQKFMRDAAVVSLFDGSTAVNLDGIGVQLQRLPATDEASAASRADRLRTWFNPGAPLPPFGPSGLQWMNGGVEDVTQGLPEVVRAIEALQGLDPEVRAELALHAATLARICAEDRDALVALARKDRAALKRSPELFDAAQRFCTTFAAAACLHLFVQGRASMDAFFASGTWLVAVLRKLVGELSFGRAAVRDRVDAALTERMLALHREDRLFAAAPIALAARGSAGTLR